MTLQVSTKYKELLFGPTAFESIFNGGRILIFSGVQPLSADYPEQGTLLAQITVFAQPWTPNGSDAGLRFTRESAYVVKDATQDWRLKCDVAGTAGWFRLVGPLLDSGGVSYASPRIDGALGAELILPSNVLTINQTIPVQEWTLTFPPVGV